MRLSGLRLFHAVLGGWTALVLFFLYVPILLVVAYSFNSADYGVAWQETTLDWYRKMAADTELVKTLVNSLIVATAATVLSIALGTAGAWLLHRYRFPGARALDTLIFIPMVVPEVIMGVSLLVLFSATFAQLAAIFPEAGRGFTTLIISHVTFCFPFVLVAVRARLAGIDPSLEEAALDLGATPRQAFFKVIVPYMMPAIVSGALMAFALSMDDIIVSSFTAGPDSKTLPLLMYGRVKKGLDPSLNAISAVIIAATLVLVIASETIKRRAAPAAR